MESLCVSKMKSWLIIFIILMVSGIEGCIEEERMALLQFKTSFIGSYGYVAPPLLSWVDDGGECCDWERVNCNTTTTHVTNLSLSNIVPDTEKDYGYCKKNWALNVSVFLDFKELTSLNLSYNCLDDGIVNTGLGRLSSLKKLEILDLSRNSITNETFPSLGALTSLRVLNLGLNKLEGYFPALALENLEILDLSYSQMKGFDQVSLLKKLKVLNLNKNKFNESFITSLSALPMLKSLDLSRNWLDRSFPVEAAATAAAGRRRHRRPPPSPIATTSSLSILHQLHVNRLREEHDKKEENLKSNNCEELKRVQLQAEYELKEKAKLLKNQHEAEKKKPSLFQIVIERRRMQIGGGHWRRSALFQVVIQVVIERRKTQGGGGSAVEKDGGRG